MYPYDILFGVGLYEICIILGLILAMAAFRILADKAKLSAALQNMVLFGIPFALFVGYPSAVAVQWIYNGIRDGKLAESVFGESTGSTFYGGLIGGAAAFLIFYFVWGHLRLKNKEHISCFSKILDIGPCCIALGHAMGRIGCFFAGCCHGIRTESFLGVYLKNVPHKVYPTQLFEAFFLLVLFAFLVLRFLDGKRNNLSVYLIGYGIWRFVIEYLRGDDRGETFVEFLTPSQLTAILLVILGVVLFFLSSKIYGKAAPAEGDATPVEKSDTPSVDGGVSSESTETEDTVGTGINAKEDGADPQ